MKGTLAKLTIFTLFTIFVTYYLATIIGNFHPFTSTYPINAVFTDATGLLNGDLVKVAGVDVGKVTGFKEQSGNAVVSMQIQSDIKLPANVNADLQYRNLLGQRVINLAPPPEGATGTLPEGGTIPVDRTSPSLDLTLLFNNLRPLIQSTNPADINTVTNAIVKVFKGHEDILGKVLGNVGDLSQTLAAKDQRLGRFITDLDKLTKVVNGQSSSIRIGLDKFTELIQSLARVTPTISNLVDHLNTASTKFGGVIHRNHANLDDELHDLRLILGIVNNNLSSVDTVAKNLKEVLLGTARAQSYGKWFNLYIVNLCPELGTGDCTPLLGGANK